ncbi:hypothetical protein M378DRAFT_159186 [Amanita muscaria Koide BX008]|uniref:Uncharacterized protein n=1 Tax=Amanita muscaria (strain Koide BX008) TaxID=946122 RepID=A0A0C2TLF3_AMAMK|nr:hypothetical protein M378DRAFT_159186 [Amanita muscaria Koide BX008]
MSNEPDDDYQVDLLTNEVTVHNMADPDDGSMRLGAQSKLVSVTPHPKSSPPTRGSPTFSTSHISPNSGSSAISPGSSTSTSTSRSNFLQVQWAKWGPYLSMVSSKQNSGAVEYEVRWPKTCCSGP